MIGLAVAPPRPDRVALVTGAAAGIGHAVALGLAESCRRVVLVDKDESALHEVARQLGPERADAVAADLVDERSVSALVESAMADHGSIDVLVNVVGGSRPGKTVVDLERAEWDQMLALNLTTTFLMCRQVIPRMVSAGGGAIVNVASGAGVRGMTANPAYCAAKAGVIGLTRALAIDHAHQGVRVNCVAPGPVRTPLMERNHTAERIGAFGRVALLGRVAEPVEVANAICWLAGDESSYVMGQTLEVDGGVASVI